MRRANHHGLKFVALVELQPGLFFYCLVAMFGVLTESSEASPADVKSTRRERETF